VSFYYGGIEGRKKKGAIRKVEKRTPSPTLYLNIRGPLFAAIETKGDRTWLRKVFSALSYPQANQSKTRRALGGQVTNAKKKNRR